MEPAANATDSIKIRVQPKASKNEILGFRGETLRLRVTAPPEGGKANEAVLSLLAETLQLAKSRLRITRGHASRDKLVAVQAVDMSGCVSVWRRPAGSAKPRSEAILQVQRVPYTNDAW
ncbi:MAG: DUF167 domain-containing protein [Dehalococcoidia bacterium]